MDVAAAAAYFAPQAGILDVLATSGKEQLLSIVPVRA
jgi:hypothetical protein